MNDRNVILFTEMMRWALDKTGLNDAGGKERDYCARFELAADDEDNFNELIIEIAGIFAKIPASLIPAEIWNGTYGEKKFADRACIEISKIHEAKNGDELVKAMGEIKKFIEENV